MVFVQQPLRHGDFFALLKQLVDGAQGLGGFLVVAKAQDRERHGLAVVGDGLQLFHNAVDGMVVVAGKKHRALVEKRRRQRVYDGVGLAGARRALHVGQRIAHGVVDGQQLVQIDLVVQQRQRVGLAAARLGGHLAEEGPQRGGGRLAGGVLEHSKDAAVLMLQVHGAVAADGDEVGQVIDPHPRVAAGDAVLDGLGVLRELVQQRIVVGIQKLMDAQLAAVDGELPADDRLRLGPQGALFHVEPQRAVGQHVQPLPGVNTDKIQPQRGQAGAGGVPVAVLDPALEPAHQLTELVVGQLQRVLLIIGKAVGVNLMDQAVVGLVGRSVQPVAGGQIVQHPQVGGVVKQRRVPPGVVADVVDERLVDGAPRAVHDLGGLDAVNADMVERLHA